MQMQAQQQAFMERMLSNQCVSAERHQRLLEDNARSDQRMLAEAVAVAAPCEKQGNNDVEESNPFEEDEEFKADVIKARNRLSKEVIKYLRAVDCQRKRAADYSLMKEDVTFCQYPKDMKPYKASPTESELDEVWSQAKDEECSLTFTFPRGTSRRKAVETIHHMMVTTQKSIYVESVNEKVASLHTATRKSIFMTSIENVVCEKFSNVGIATLGLEEPKRPKPSSALVQRNAEQIYKDLMDRVADQRKKEENIKERRRREEEST